MAFQSLRASDFIHYIDSVLPAILPPIAIAAGVVARVHRPVLVAAVAALASCYPRFGGAQLLFALAFFWVVAAASVPRRTQSWVGAVAILIAFGSTAVAWPKEKLKSIETPVGTLEVSRLHFVTLHDLLEVTHPGERVFVYPYLPALYFALGVDNPTRYAWLQPGMMSDGDVRSTVASLRSKPPRWVVWHDFTEGYILKNWPGSDRTRLRFPEMESYLRSAYHVVVPDGVPTVGYKLMERNP